MRTLSILLSLLLLAAEAGAATTYRWTDADGVHYSDQPHAGAEKIFLGQTQTYSSAEADVPSTPTPRPARAAREQSADFHYNSCAILQPADDQVLFDVESTTVSVQLQPAKRSSDRLALSFDGQPVEPTGSEQTTFRIMPIDRGTHTAAVTVRDADGKILCQSAAVTFHVRQPSVLAPLNPNRPR